MSNIICGDNIRIMAGIPDDAIDLTVTSPPYDNLRQYKGYTFDFDAIASQLYRITKPGGVIVWVVADQSKDWDESGESFRQALGFKDAGFNLLHTMIYQRQRRQVGTPAGAYFDDFEYMFILSKGKPKTYNVIRDVKNAQGGNGARHHSRTPDGVQHYTKHVSIDDMGKRGRIWFYNTGLYHSSHDKIAFKHPAIFPERLAADHIKTWSNPGDMVLDPFLGSGTTIKMAEHLDRVSIGIDISYEYCLIASQRTKTSQKRLF